MSGTPTPKCGTCGGTGKVNGKMDAFNPSGHKQTCPDCSSGIKVPGSVPMANVTEDAKEAEPDEIHITSKGGIWSRNKAIAEAEAGRGTPTGRTPARKHAGYRLAIGRDSGKCSACLHPMEDPPDYPPCESVGTPTGLGLGRVTAADVAFIMGEPGTYAIVDAKDPLPSPIGLIQTHPSDGITVTTIDPRIQPTGRTPAPEPWSSAGRCQLVGCCEPVRAGRWYCERHDTPNAIGPNAPTPGSATGGDQHDDLPCLEHRYAVENERLRTDLAAALKREGEARLVLHRARTYVDDSSPIADYIDEQDRKLGWPVGTGKGAREARERATRLEAALVIIAADGCAFEGSYDDCFAAMDNDDPEADGPCPKCIAARALAPVPTAEAAKPTTMQPGQRCTLAVSAAHDTGHVFNPKFEDAWQRNRFLAWETRCPYVAAEAAKEPT